MTPTFALTLSPEGISLYQSDPSGVSAHMLGSVSLEDPEFAARLADLRALGESAAGEEPFATALVLPNSQVLYKVLPDEPGAEPRVRAAEALIGATPYELDELVYDCKVQGGRLWIAAVARETLEEAEDFASLHRFNPVSFNAEPSDEDFPDAAFFGATGQAAQWLPLGETPEPEHRHLPEAPVEDDMPVAEAEGPEEPADEPILPDEPENPAAAPEPETASEVEVEPEAAEDVTADAAVGDLFSEDTEAQPEEAEADEAPYEEILDADTPDDVAEPARAEAPPPVETAETLEDQPEEITAEEDIPAPMIEVEDADAPVAEAEAPTGEAEPSAEAKVPADEAEPPAAAKAPDDEGEVEDEDDDLAPPPTFASIRTQAAKPPLAAPPRGAKPAAGPKPARSDAPKSAAGIAASIAGSAAASRAPAKSPAAPPRSPAKARTGRDDLSVFGAQQPARKRKARLLVGVAIGAVVLLGLAGLWAQVLDGSDDTPSMQLADSTPAPLIEPETPDIAPEATDSTALQPGQPAEQETATLAAPAPDAAPVTEEPQQPDLAEAEADIPAEPLVDDLSAAVTTETVGAPAEATTSPTVADTLALLTDTPAGTAPAEGATDDPLTTRAIYASTGIWQRAPEQGYLPQEDDLENLEIASIDPNRIDKDAFALPDLAALPETRPRLPVAPRHPDDERSFDENGLVVPTEEGVISPGGVLIRSGRPFIVPPKRVAPLDAPAEVATADADDPLAGFRPRGRPGDLEETTERATLGGRTLSELAEVRPLRRPVSEQQEAEQLDEVLRLAAADAATLEELADAEGEPDDTGAELSPEEAALAADLATATRRAIPASPIPRLRPANIAQIADRAQRVAEAEAQRLQEAADVAVMEAEAARVLETQQAALAQSQAQARAQAEAAAKARAEAEARAQAAAAARAEEAAEAAAAASAARATGPAVPNRNKAKPTGPINAAVAKQATVKNALALNKVSLIGVYGTSNQRRALVRLPSGKYLKVQVGDRLDGGRVAAIGSSELLYSKSGRNITLTMPKG
ncbi:hypothetical protein [Tropicimonas aquimaris]|uniref:Type IV pilus biogenesis n=1 Tax=Tropicimonas aquimaris TaxID=914152 RepID=A0ABW3INQ3_9RHOB